MSLVRQLGLPPGVEESYEGFLETPLPGGLVLLMRRAGQAQRDLIILDVNTGHRCVAVRDDEMYGPSTIWFGFSHFLVSSSEQKTMVTNLRSGSRQELRAMGIARVPGEVSVLGNMSWAPGSLWGVQCPEVAGRFDGIDCVLVAAGAEVRLVRVGPGWDDFYESERGEAVLTKTSDPGVFERAVFSREGRQLFRAKMAVNEYEFALVDQKGCAARVEVRRDTMSWRVFYLDDNLRSYRKRLQWITSTRPTLRLDGRVEDNSGRVSQAKRVLAEDRRGHKAVTLYDNLELTLTLFGVNSRRARLDTSGWLWGHRGVMVVLSGRGTEVTVFSGRNARRCSLHPEHDPCLGRLLGVLRGLGLGQVCA